MLLTAALAPLHISALPRYPKTKQKWALIAQNLASKTKLQDNWWIIASEPWFIQVLPRAESSTPTAYGSQHWRRDA